jgi:hypothetical protein
MKKSLAAAPDAPKSSPCCAADGCCASPLAARTLPASGARAQQRQHKMAMRRLVPLLDRVLVERIIAPTKSAGGVLLPETAVQKVQLARASGSQLRTAAIRRGPGDQGHQ